MNSFGDTAKGLSRNPLGIIALFIVLIYGFASLVVGFSDRLHPEERLPIVWFLVLFPIVVLSVFAWLVSNHHPKLYAPQDYTNDQAFLDSIGGKEDPESFDQKIERKIFEAVTAEEFVKKLSSQSEPVEEILGDIAARASKDVIDSEFVEIDARRFTDDETKIFSYPVSTFADLNSFTNRIFFNLKEHIPPYAYGHKWILRNAATGGIIKNARMITGSGAGEPVHDSRPLEEVGIRGGTKLTVEFPNSHNKRVN